MGKVAIVCNALLCAFTGSVILTDGAPRDALYAVFGALLLLVPALTVWVILRGGPVLKLAALAANVVLVVSVVLAIVDQYPHPSEDGFVAYVLVVLVTPVLSAVVLARGGAAEGWRRLLGWRPAAGS